MLLGIRVQRNDCSSGGGSSRKAWLWGEYINCSCRNPLIVWRLYGSQRARWRFVQAGRVIANLERARAAGLVKLCSWHQCGHWGMLWGCWRWSRVGESGSAWWRADVEAEDEILRATGPGFKVWRRAASATVPLTSQNHKSLPGLRLRVNASSKHSQPPPPGSNCPQFGAVPGLRSAAGASSSASAHERAGWGLARSQQRPRRKKVRGPPCSDCLCCTLPTVPASCIHLSR